MYLFHLTKIRQPSFDKQWDAGDFDGGYGVRHPGPQAVRGRWAWATGRSRRRETDDMNSLQADMVVALLLVDGGEEGRDVAEIAA